MVTRRGEASSFLRRRRCLGLHDGPADLLPQAFGDQHVHLDLPTAPHPICAPAEGALHGARFGGLMRRAFLTLLLATSLPAPALADGLIDMSSVNQQVSDAENRAHNSIQGGLAPDDKASASKGKGKGKTPQK